MSRAHATALTLVNWKGVFFERYALDRHVTALEGANGAGKTTVMVAAYVVLLPDLTRLKFTNLGETGATGGDRGIYGRLGEPGPSYAALDIDLGDGSRIVAGVHLERKASPALSLTPFVLSEGPEAIAGDRLFLRPTELHEEVRTLKELAQAVKDAGGTLTTFPSSKEYFAHLFERGISPLRLGSDEERNKFNEMLRTSMTGGISRTLTSELRSFLLERESGLFDTLGRMRKNLDACRRTRVEVAEARVLEQEINGIYTAGEAMFSAALDASRKEASESQRALLRVEREWQSAHARARELETQAREAELAKSGLQPRLERARDRELALRERSARLERAHRARGRVLEVEAALAQALPEAEAALARKADWTRLRQSAKQERDQAQTARGRAAAGLASLQVGLEELHRRAHSFRRARQELEGARRAHAALLLGGAAAPTGSPDGSQALEPLRQLFATADTLEAAAANDPAAESDGLSSELLASASRAVRDVRDQTDRELAEHERRAAAAEQRRRDHAEACLALRRVSGGSMSEQPARQARQELGRLNELELLGARATELALEARRLATLAEKRTRLATELAGLGLEPLPSARAFADELAALESAARSCERAQHDRQSAASLAAERAAAARARRPALEARADRHRQLLHVLGRLQARQELAPTSRRELETRLGDLDQQRELLRDEAAHWSRERRAAWDAARELEAAGENLEAGLLALAERVEGELLAQRYEDLDLDRARRVEAELGPLSRAIVVDDPWQAAGSLLEQANELDCVWLLRSGAAWPLGAHASTSATAAPRAVALEPSGHAIVDLGYGLRVTRLPATVSLGRAARARRVEELRALAERLGRDIDASERRQRDLLEARRDLELLGQDWELWALGDPAPDLERCHAEEASALEARAQAEAEARTARLEAARIDVRLAALRSHLPDHHLLDLPDVASQAARARVLSESARGARAELERVQDARQSLARLLHSLDVPLPANDGAEDTAQRLASRRDQLFALGEALAALESARHAWGWAHAERALGERTELVPELEAQHTAARRELELAQAGFERSELEWEGATALAQEQSARLAALQAHLERARAELAAESIDDASDAALEQARAELVGSAHELEQIAAALRGVDAELALRVERAQQAELGAQTAERVLLGERQRGEPLEQRWRDFAERARAAGVLEPGPLAGADAAEVPSSRRWLEAQAKRALLADRLAAARGAAELAGQASRAAPGAGLEPATAYLELWLETRQWLLARLPAPLAALGEPLLGLARLRADLGELESRLDRQEGDLRGTSGDVARSIDVQVRRAAARVRRLNRALEGVSFGSIAAIRVQLDRVAKMDSILRALREGETQELLFQSNLPLEEALDEIFRRHAGGRGGGQRLVDYREYLELSVQIQRQTSASWERVNPSQVSTGEAIGVGAALMMVILAEWEREDQLLQRERKLGSLRFLFLDEANRLSKDNLAVLFELCRTLDLQLLIAAPEVAHAEGNTTYHLVRRVSAEGREQVFVTGRRASLPAAPALRPNGAEPAAAQQLPLIAS